MQEMPAFIRSLYNRVPRFFAGGMDPCDFLEIMKTTENWDDWIRGVTKYADERLALADEALAGNRNLSAGEYFLAAGIYYHFAVLSYFENLELKAEIKAKSQKAYKKGMSLIEPPIRRLDIPHDGYTMAAHLRLPQTGEAPYPLVFLLPGVDSVKEEYFPFSEVLLKRGLATLAFEGPGQGETRAFAPMMDYERAFSSAFDYVSALPEICEERISIYGRSMGGYLGPRIAASDKRIKALVSAGGIYEMPYWDTLSAGVRGNFTHAWGFDNFDSAGEYAKNNITLDGIIPQIECPFLIIHSDLDHNYPASYAVRMKEEAKCECELLIYPEGIHVADNIRYKYQPYVADWLASKLN